MNIFGKSLKNTQSPNHSESMDISIYKLDLLSPSQICYANLDSVLDSIERPSVIYPHKRYRYVPAQGVINYIGDFITFNVLPLAISAPLHPKFPLREAELEVCWKADVCRRRFVSFFFFFFFSLPPRSQTAYL